MDVVLHAPESIEVKVLILTRNAHSKQEHMQITEVKYVHIRNYESK